MAKIKFLDGQEIHGNVTINTSGITDNVVLTSTDTSASSAPDLVLYRNAAVADEDTLGIVEFKGKNGMVPSSATPFTYGSVSLRMNDVSDNLSSISFAVNKGNGSGAFLQAASISARGSNNSATGTVIVNPASLFAIADYNLQVEGTTGLKGQTTITSIPSVGSDTDKFLMSNSGLVSFATGAEVLSYIGAASTGSLGNYLPLAGGTMTGNIVMDDGSGASPNIQFTNQNNDSWYIYNDSNGKFQVQQSSTIRATFSSGDLEVRTPLKVSEGAVSISSDGANYATLTESGSGDFEIHAADDLRLNADGHDIVLKGASNEFGRLKNNSGNFDITGSDITIDASGDITLDAAGNDIRFFKAGVEYGKIKSDSNNLAIFSSISNEDILFKGNDDGTTITALTLDMSDNGRALFRGPLNVGEDIAGSINLKDSGTTYASLYKYGGSLFIQTASTGETVTMGAPTSWEQHLRVMGDVNADNYKINGAQGSDGQVLTSTGSGVAWEDVPAAYTLPAATSTVRGGVELFSDTVQSTSANTVTSTTGRTYGVQVNSAAQMVVNVPWSDTTGSNNYVDSVSFATGTGVLTLGRNGLSDLTVDLDGRYVPLTGGSGSGNAMTGDLWIKAGDPKIYLQDTSDDDDQAIIFRNNAGTDEYKIATQDFTSGGAGDGFSLGSISSDPVRIVAANTTALTFDTSQNAQFSAKVGVGMAATDPLEVSGNIRANVSNAGGFMLTGASASGLVRNGGTGLALRTNTTDRLVIDASSNASFLGGGTVSVTGDLDVQGSGITLVDDIIFSGSGRIQGIDTVSASTDAASKGYVDTQISGVPQGTVTSVTSGNSNTITVSNSTTTPVIAANVGAVSSSSSNLATGAQIQTAINTAVTGVLSFQGSWNANTNTPTLSSGSGTPGYYYIVGTAGSTNLDGITDWQVGDWAVFSDLATDAWQKIDNTQVGNVTGSGVDNRIAIWNGTSAIDSDSDFRVDGDTIFTQNLEAAGNITASGKLVTPEVESSSTILLDAAADITIDAGGSDIILSDDGTIFGTISSGGGSNLQIRSRINDADMFLRGVDNGTEFNALHLDMSAAGSAYFNSNVILSNGDLYGKSVNADFSRMYRWGGIFFTWDSDTYGTQLNHSITSTDNGTYSDSITINSYDKVRINIDSNNNDSGATFSIGEHGTGSSGTIFTVEGGGNVDMISGNVQGKFAVKSTGVHASYDFYNDGTTYLNGSVTIDDALTVTSIANALSDTDKFLVSDSGVLKYRTGAQVRSDIGAGTGSGTVTSVATGSGLTGGTITGSGTVSVDYGGSGLVNDAPGGTGNPDQDDLVLIGLDSSGSGETRSFALVDLPFTNNQGDITAVTAGTGLSGGGTTGAVTLTNSDRGSSQNIFKNVAVSGQNTVVADSNNDTLTLAAGSNITLTTNSSTDTIIITGTDTNTNNYLNSLSWNTSTGVLTAGRLGLSDITVDLDGRYVTSSGVTSVASGTGITGGTITSTGTLSLDLNELTTTTGSGNADFFAIVNSSGSQYKIAPGDIDISTLNNDAGFTTNSGTVTGSGSTNELAYWTSSSNISHRNNVYTPANSTIVLGSSGTGDVYIGAYGSGNYARFHTNNSDTFFDMNCGNVNFRQSSNTRFDLDMTNGVMTATSGFVANSTVWLGAKNTAGPNITHQGGNSLQMNYNGGGSGDWRVVDNGTSTSAIVLQMLGSGSTGPLGTMKLGMYIGTNFSTSSSPNLAPITVQRPASGAGNDTICLLGVMADGTVVRGEQEYTFKFSRVQMNSLPGSGGYTLVTAPGVGKGLIVTESICMIEYTSTGAGFSGGSSETGYDIRQANNNANATVARFTRVQLNTITNNSNSSASNKFGWTYRDVPVGSGFRYYQENRPITLHSSYSNFTVASLVANVTFKIKVRLVDSANF